MNRSRTARAARSAGPGERPALPVQRSRRDAPPAGVGWWQPPKAKAGSPDDSARHRVPDATEVLPGSLAPGGRRGPASRRSRRRMQLTPAQRSARRRRRLLHAALGGAATVVLAPVLAFVAGYLLFTVPSPDDAVNNQVALVSFADGTPLTRLVPEEGNRIKVSIEQVPVHVRHAVLAAEDRTFYSNPGFDLTGILRAAWNQLRGGVGGGSTITQQFVKKALVGAEQTLWRKYKEVVLAVKISQERSKDEILADYLNTIYFGRGAYGIQSAAQAYFGKNVQDLTVSEGALLAGVIQSPSRWDPAVSPERAVERWNFVLDGMTSQGWLDAGTRATLGFPPTSGTRSFSRGVPADSSGHIVTAVTAELADLGISDQALAQDGLRITTTIDPRRQEHAVAAVHETLAGQPVNLRSSMVAIDPATGGVRAYYGGENGVGLDYAQVRRLAGSTFKPFVVLAGLLQDPPVGLGEVFDGTEVPGLRNADGAECERCDLKQAMTMSNNVVFHSLARQVGPEAVAAAARAAGITAPLEDPTAGIALGNKEVSAFELASAYATLAAGGVWHQPHFVASVVTADGSVLYEAAVEGERRFPERVARNVTESMLEVAAHDGLALPGAQPVAAKTGTVQSRFEGENNDAWIAGFTPTLATSVWMGTDMNSPIRTARGAPVEGAGLPGEVWQLFMTDALAGEPVQQFAPFRPIGEAPSTAPPNAPTTAPTPVPPATAAPDANDPDAPPAPNAPPDPNAPPGGAAPSPGSPVPGAPGGPEQGPPPPDGGAPAGGPGEVAPTPTPQPGGDGADGAPRLFGGDPEPTPRQDCSVTPCG
ncbi:transglycosylase domain-containing protein [Pseudonocardia nigra]|uniref:transglycosylase domain-containing protein n=1 Tax=Pseudonocardia nigra TaxID=1921578 RepID=UPI0027E39C61|nr:transglycosylase domain-containing protein [Pseudonocardia nigra]